MIVKSILVYAIAMIGKGRILVKAMKRMMKRKKMKSQKMRTRPMCNSDNPN
jgi:hypothetical protein